jgi:hypothetical protein
MIGGPPYPAVNSCTARQEFVVPGVDTDLAGMLRIADVT